MELFLIVVGAVLLTAGVTGFTVAFKRLGKVTSIHDAAVQPNQALLGISIIASSAGFLPLLLGILKLVLR